MLLRHGENDEYRVAAALFIVTLTVSAACAGFWYYQPLIVYRKLIKNEDTLTRVLPPDAVRWAIDRTSTRLGHRQYELFKRDMKRL